MPTFTAIALDRLLEPGASKSVDKSVSLPMPACASNPVPTLYPERRNSTERKGPRPPIKPALYTTPEVTPLPDSPSSFPPSPYIINHKRRGPRLLKSSSEAIASSNQRVSDDENINGQAKDVSAAVLNPTNDISVTHSISEPAEVQNVNGVHHNEGNKGNSDVGHGNEEIESSSTAHGASEENGSLRLVASNLEKDGETEDFFDPQDPMSLASTSAGDDNTVAESSVKLTTTGVEFFDAWEELSSESGTQSTCYDAEAELREIRLSLLMEIEKRKQAEETLRNMQSQWERIRQQLLCAGLMFPSDPSAVTEDELVDFDPAEDLSQQVFIARFVSNIIGRGTARAEIELEMEAQIKSKNFEIARLLDRLHYYETVNQEMSQRNQEAVEMARRERQRRNKRRRWIWGSIATAIALGTAAIAWSCIPVGRGSSSANNFEVHEHDDNA